MRYIESSLHQKYGTEELLTLIPASNSGGQTYDGIDVCGERAIREIEKLVALHSQQGHEITRFSVVGYSLGGLIARYVVGVLFQKGWFTRIKPVNYTAFACPQLGVRSPHRGPVSWMYNNIVSTSISATGAQLCGVDNFGGTGHSLLSILADPQRNFLRALTLFENRSLYANISNDRFAVHYTTAITQSPPYTDLRRLNISYLEGYGGVLLDPAKPPMAIQNNDDGIRQKLSTISSRAAFVVAFTIWALAIVIPGFIVYSVVQNIRSKQRIHLLKQQGLLENQSALLLPEEDALVGDTELVSSSKPSKSDIVNSDPIPPMEMQVCLGLTDEQQAMMEALNEVGFRKHFVHIKNTIFSHSAIVVRRNGNMFSEGRGVIEHWLDHGFVI